MRTARLNNWTLGHSPEDPEGTLCLFGEVYGHPDFPDGKAVVTSIVREFDLIKREAKTQFTHYILLKHSPQVIERCRAIFTNIVPEYDVLVRQAFHVPEDS